MNLSRASYYAEVTFYPVVVTGIGLAHVIADGSRSGWSWLLICLVGLSYGPSLNTLCTDSFCTGYR
jgi:hypothetical protein